MHCQSSFANNALNVVDLRLAIFITTSFVLALHASSHCITQESFLGLTASIDSQRNTPTPAYALYGAFYGYDE